MSDRAKCAKMSDVVKKDSLAQHGLHSNLNTNLNNVISRYSQTNILKENKSSDVMHLRVLKGKPQVPQRRQRSIKIGLKFSSPLKTAP